MSDTSDMSRFMGEVFVDINRARRKFPSPDGLMTALTEEVGELAKALLSEPHENVYGEAVQVAAMACRVALEGDSTLDLIRAERVEGYVGDPAQEDPEP